MSIKSQVERIADAKSAIAQAIEAYGIDVPSTALLDDMPDLIGNIRAAVLDSLYPVGSSCITTENVNPGAQLGGTWEWLAVSDAGQIANAIYFPLSLSEDGGALGYIATYYTWRRTA